MAQSEGEFVWFTPDENVLVVLDLGASSPDLRPYAVRKDGMWAWSEDPHGKTHALEPIPWVDLRDTSIGNLAVYTTKESAPDSEPFSTSDDNTNLSSDSPRAKVLQEAEQLVTGDRNASYGTPTQNFQNTADLFTIQFRHLLKEGARFGPGDVAVAMMQLKMARLIAGMDKRDTWVDLAGYAACGWEATSDHVHESAPKE